MDSHEQTSRSYFKAYSKFAFTFFFFFFMAFVTLFPILSGNSLSLSFARTNLPPPLGLSATLSRISDKQTGYKHSH